MSSSQKRSPAATYLVSAGMMFRGAIADVTLIEQVEPAPTLDEIDAARAGTTCRLALAPGRLSRNTCRDFRCELRSLQ